MSAKLGMSLDDIVAKEAPKKGGGKGGAKGGGKGGAMKRMGAGRGARAAAAPYQKPVRPGKGGKGQMAAAEEPAAQAQPTFTLTTGTTVRVANLAYNVTRYIICRIGQRNILLAAYAGRNLAAPAAQFMHPWQHAATARLSHASLTRGRSRLPALPSVSQRGHRRTFRRDRRSQVGLAADQ